MTWRPRVIDVAVLCLVGFFGLILTLGAITGAAERDPAAGHRWPGCSDSAW